MYHIKPTNKFKKDLNLAVKQGKNIELLTEIVDKLAAGKSLPKSCREHFLGGNWQGWKECHIMPDWLLIYKIDTYEESIVLSRLGSHSELF
ncbi:MAG: type II toxin-antitoxin system YafQ family toxin [Oscillospiraceae bacterium]|jgi:mRNA interferase YafQ|nr:type II toxin-antitoxin system YafQ family toxin [Oscillospiraceae bacterium]